MPSLLIFNFPPVQKWARLAACGRETRAINKDPRAAASLSQNVMETVTDEQPAKSIPAGIEAYAHFCCGNLGVSWERPQ
jgi:hypothetical protein